MRRSKLVCSFKHKMLAVTNKWTVRKKKNRMLLKKRLSRTNPLKYRTPQVVYLPNQFNHMKLLWKLKPLMFQMVVKKTEMKDQMVKEMKT